MSNVRVQRVGEQIKKELSFLFAKELKDPRIGFVTITAVEMTGDLQQAKVFLSVLGDDQQKEDTLKAIDKASGFIRSSIGKKVRLRLTPELIFHFDHSLEYGSHIEKLLKQMNEKE